jgi:transforming growth factor-beta-induced protein
LRNAAVVFVAIAFALVASSAAQSQTIWQTVASNPEFSLLGQFLTQANLVSALSNPSAGLTVFAPTNAAFAKLSPQIAAYLANPTHSAQLSAVLLSHVCPFLLSAITCIFIGLTPFRIMVQVVNAVVYSSRLTDGLTVATLSGQWVTFRVRNAGLAGVRVSVNASDVTTADVAASNGVIHIVDRVLLPSQFSLVPPTATIGALASQTPQLSFLFSALRVSGLAPVFLGNGTFTVFAPVDSAFTPEIRKALLSDANLLANVLKYHVLGAVVPSTSLSDGLAAASLQGSPVVASRSSFGGQYYTFINDAQVIIPDIAATNGIIHVVDRVLLPPN